MEYQHGGDIYSQEIDLDYSANINPFGMPESIRDAMIRAIGDCIHYPDSQCRKLRQELAHIHGLSWGNIICANGAADAIFQAIQAIKPRKTAILSPTFSEYRQALVAAGSEIKAFQLQAEYGFKLTALEFISFLDQSFQMAILCNPNNPTGISVSGKDMKAILEHCEGKGIYLLVDECFMDFTMCEKENSLISCCEQYPHLLVLKAFTKMFGMAGVRLGYLCCLDEWVLEQMELLRQPWSVSTLAQEAGLAALKETEFVIKTRTLIQEEKSFLAKELTTLGFKVFESEVNYLLFSDVMEAEEKDLYERCRSRKLLIRWCGTYEGLHGRYYRICIKTREENVRLIFILKEVLGERKAIWQR